LQSGADRSRFGSWAYCMWDQQCGTWWDRIRDPPCRPYGSCFQAGKTGQLASVHHLMVLESRSTLLSKHHSSSGHQMPW
jgi:hypothetical protein